MIKIVSLIMGSRLQGLDQPDSDVDEFHIYVESFDELLKNIPAPARYDSEDRESDVTSYTLREVANGIERGQIGFYSMLWVPESHTIESSLFWKRLVERRKEFLSRAIIENTNEIANILLNRDFKSCSHALRILYSLFQLTAMERMTFPSPISDDLIAIRNGKQSYKHMYDLVNKVRKSIFEREDWPDTGIKIWESVIDIYKEMQNADSNS